MRILVTGGSGFLGSHIIDHLTSLGHDVVSYDIVKSKFLNENSFTAKSMMQNKIPMPLW